MCRSHLAVSNLLTGIIQVCRWPVRDRYLTQRTTCCFILCYCVKLGNSAFGSWNQKPSVDHSLSLCLHTALRRRSHEEILITPSTNTAWDSAESCLSQELACMQSHAVVTWPTPKKEKKKKRKTGGKGPVNLQSRPLPPIVLTGFLRWTSGAGHVCWLAMFSRRPYF